MSRNFILDGYNVIHTDRRWADLPREEKREQFLRTLETSRASGGERNPITVVLDGYAAGLKGIRLKSVRLIFSGDRDADTVIKDMINELQNPKETVVVTNDRSLRSAVQHMGAQGMSCEDFFLLKYKKTTSQKTDKPDPQSAESINKELKRLWKLE